MSEEKGFFEDVEPIAPEEITGKHHAEPATVVPQHHWDDNEQRVELPDKPERKPALPKPEDESSSVPTFPGAQEVLAPAPMDLTLPDPNAKGPWIQYNGVATVRILGPRDWHQAGVRSMKYCEWNYLNGKRLPRSLFNDEELQYLLRVDGRFSLET